MTIATAYILKSQEMTILRLYNKMNSENINKLLKLQGNCVYLHFRVLHWCL